MTVAAQQLAQHGRTTADPQVRAHLGRIPFALGGAGGDGLLPIPFPIEDDRQEVSPLPAAIRAEAVVATVTMPAWVAAFGPTVVAQAVEAMAVTRATALARAAVVGATAVLAGTRVAVGATAALLSSAGDRASLRARSRVDPGAASFRAGAESATAERWRSRDSRERPEFDRDRETFKRGRDPK